MSHEFQIIDAQKFHCGQMARRLRKEHNLAISRVGADAHRVLRERFGESSFCKAWLIDGRLAALGGVTGSPLSPFGYVWVALTQEALRHKIAIIKEARRQLDTIMQTRHELVATLLGDDEPARRFAIFLGFHVKHDGNGDVAESRAARRALGKLLDSDPDLRTPIGDSFMIVMGYHAHDAMHGALQEESDRPCA